MTNSKIAKALLALATKLAATPEEIRRRFEEEAPLTPEQAEEVRRKQMRKSPRFKETIEQGAIVKHQAVADYLATVLDDLRNEKGSPAEVYKKLLEKLEHDQHLFTQAVQHRTKRATLARKLIAVAQLLIT